MSLDAAIAAADFATILARPMQEKPIGRCIVDGAGKSAASTAGAVDGNRKLRALAGGIDGINGAQDAAGGMIGPDPDGTDSDIRQRLSSGAGTLTAPKT